MTSENKSIAEENAIAKITAAAWRGVGRSFRGEMYDDDPDNPNLKDFLACHFHRKILRDAIKKTTRRIGVRAANQLGKTTILEIIAKFLMKHRPADMLMWDMNEAKSDDHMKNRFMPILRADPVLGPVFRSIAATPETRWDVCTTNILLPGMVFRARPLNEQWVQSFPAKYGFLHDAALVESHFVRKIEVRFTKYESSYLWCCESQGDAPMGSLGGGFSDFMGKTNEMKLHVRCPVCRTQVRFLFYGQRNDETKIVAPTSIPSLDWEAWVSHNRPILLSDDRKHFGFKVAGELKRSDGGINEIEIMRSTVYECPHCGGHWKDDNTYHSGGSVTYGDTRIYLDREAGIDDNWIPSRTTALPGFLGYSLPRWINPRPSWGAVMLTFKQAMMSKKMGNLMPLQEFRTKWEGEDWNAEKEERSAIEISMGNYETDPEKLMPNSHCRQVTTDCGKAEDAGPDENRIGLLWFDIWEWDKQSNGRQLSYGVVNSWALLAAQQRFWKVPSARTFVDCGWMPSQVEENAVKFFDLQKFGPLQVPHAWKLIVGAGQNRRMTVPGQNRGIAYSVDKMPGRERTAHDASGKLWKFHVYKLTWSNLAFEKQLDSILAKGVTQSLEFLPKDKMVIIGLDGKPDVDLTKFSLERCRDSGNKFASYDSQLGARRYKELSGKYEDYEKQNRPTEFRDTLLMQLAGIAKDGLMGHDFTDDKPKS